MKRQFIYLIAFTLFLTSNLFAQEKIFKPFSVSLGFTINNPINSNIVESASTGLYIEPKYNFNDRLFLGLRYEYSYFHLLDGGYVDDGNNITSVNYYDNADTKSTLLIAEYYFNTEKTRPFVGLGLGTYTASTYEKGIYHYLDYNFDLFIDQGKRTNFGIMPRIGLNSGHFKLMVAYNYTGDDIADYTSINIAFDLGGGRFIKEKKENKKRGFWNKKD